MRKPMKTMETCSYAPAEKMCAQQSLGAPVLLGGGIFLRIYGGRGYALVEAQMKIGNDGYGEQGISREPPHGMLRHTM